jgi:hypothetical protein
MLVREQFPAFGSTTGQSCATGLRTAGLTGQRVEKDQGNGVMALEISKSITPLFSRLPSINQLMRALGPPCHTMETCVSRSLVFEFQLAR